MSCINLSEDDTYFQILVNKITVVAAPRGSGKSYLTVQYLKHYSHLYGYIFILCPSLEFNDDYSLFSKDLKFKFIRKPTREKIDEIFEAQAECMRNTRRINKSSRIKYGKDTSVCPNTLIILDDCIDSDILDFRSNIDKIAERGRHIKLSLWINSQRISSISRSVRINADYFIIFSPASIGEFEQFIEQFVPKKYKKCFRENIDTLFDEEYNFLILDNTEKTISRKLKISTADDLLMGKSFLINYI